MSGGKSRSVDPTASLSWMVKPEPAGISRSIDRTATSSTRARGGASDRIRSTKASNRLDRAGDLDQNLPRPVDDLAVEPELRRQPPHERPEPDALDDAADFDGSRHAISAAPRASRPVPGLLRAPDVSPP